MRPRSWLGGGSSSPKRRLKASRSSSLSCLAAQQDHRMLGPGALDRREVRVAQPPQIDAGDLRAHRRRHRTHRHRHVASSIPGRDDRPAVAADQAPSIGASQSTSLVGDGRRDRPAEAGIGRPGDELEIVADRRNDHRLARRAALAQGVDQRLHVLHRHDLAVGRALQHQAGQSSRRAAPAPDRRPAGVCRNGPA